MDDILTLTMNPALDVATSTEQVRPLDKLRCSAPRYDPGGGGINVARAITILGGKAKAVFPSGGPAGRMLEELLGAAQISFAPVAIAGFTRESFTVDEEQGGRQFRFVLPGPELLPDEQEACFRLIETSSPAPVYVVASGSFPPGLRAGFLGKLAAVCRTIGARLVLDTASATLDSLTGCEVFLIKPNLRELEALVGYTLVDEADQVEAARELIARRCTTAVAVSRGADGALLVTGKSRLAVPAIEVPTVSAVGAGDSMLAAIVLALVRGDTLEGAMRFGVAAGAAALLTPGTELLRRDDVERLAAAHSG